LLTSLRDKAAELTDKARQYRAEHQDQINAGLQKAEHVVDQKTDGQYRERLAQASSKAQTYLTQTGTHSMSEPSVNDLSPILAPGVENEPMLLLDTTGSMSYPIAEGSKIERRQVVGEAIGRIVDVMGAKDSQAAKEQAAGEEAGGLMTVTFAGGTSECIDDLSPTNWRQKWSAIRWGGGTQIVPGWETLVDTYMTEFGNVPKLDRPHLLALIITDGEASDTAQFVKSLEQTKAGTYVCIAILGFGSEHDAALATYQQVAAGNDHVRVVTFGSETDPTVIADGILSMIGS